MITKKYLNLLYDFKNELSNENIYYRKMYEPYSQRDKLNLKLIEEFEKILKGGEQNR